MIKPPPSDRSSCSTNLLRRTRRIERAAEHLKSQMNRNRKMIRKNPKEFFNSHNQAKRECDKLRAIRGNEKAFRSTPWHYAKSICSDKNSTSGNLSCSNSEAFNYFRKSFEDGNQYSGFSAWVEDVMLVPPDDKLMPFDMSPVTPSVIKGF